VILKNGEQILAFTIDIKKNKLVNKLDILVADSFPCEKPYFEDDNLTKLTADFKDSIPEVGLMVLKNVYVFGNGCILGEGRERIQSKYLPYTFLNSERGLKLSAGALRQLSDTQWRTRPLRIKEVKETAAFLLHPGDAIFGHWLVDLIPMFSLIKKHFPNAKPIIKQGVLSGERIPDLNHIWDLFGLHKNSALGLTANLDAFYCRELIVPTSVRYGQQVHPIVYDTYKPLQSNTVHDAPKKLYISRSRWKPSGSHRVLLNADEVERTYLEQGFEIIHPEELAFPDKLELLRNTKEIVGEKGTALHLSLFTNTIRKMTVILNPSENMNGLPMLQGELCKYQNINCSYIIGKQKNDGSGYTVNI
jgi:hypothetical protein